MLEYLIHNGIDLDAQDRQGLTALHIACLQGHLSTAKLMASHGAALHLVTREGFTAVELAAIKGYDASGISEEAEEQVAIIKHDMEEGDESTPFEVNPNDLPEEERERVMKLRPDAPQ